ncbi:MAG: phosphopentomutase [Eubacteriales bacterium]
MTHTPTHPAADRSPAGGNPVRRVFLLVLDSVGAGAMPDAARYGDEGAHTLRTVSRSPLFSVPTLQSLGIGNIEGLSFLGPVAAPRAAVGKLAELSAGKDTTTGHWEIAGIVSPTPLPTFPDGFPPALVERFSRACGRPVLCNRPYSGTQVIADYGAEHRQTGALIVYTSADSVFQIAAHVDVVPLGELYRCCRVARELLVGPYAVGRVIARPFAGDAPRFYRTPDRRDFSLPPPPPTLLDALQAAGREVIAVGKIADIFAGRGVTLSDPAHGNEACLAATERFAGQDFEGLCFVNLVDFDMNYGHRNDIDGYAGALSAFDRWLSAFLPTLRPEDVLLLTADHGCDPGDPSTDHSREYVPLLVYGRQIRPVPLGVRTGFTDIAATVGEWLGVPYDSGRSFAALTRRAKEDV